MCDTCGHLRPSLAGGPTRRRREDLRLFQLHQTQSGMQPPSINAAVSALRFFFTVTLDLPDPARRLTVVPYPRRIPAVLSVEEVTLLLRAASAPKHKAAFATAYGAVDGCGHWDRGATPPQIPLAWLYDSTARVAPAGRPHQNERPIDGSSLVPAYFPAPAPTMMVL